MLDCRTLSLRGCAAREDVGEDEMALLIVRPSGDLVFVSTEMPKVDPVEGDRVLRVLRRKPTLAVA